MKTAKFECEILTPMFAGTAIPGQCELRPPAIKGALRFWWRAMHGGKYPGNMLERENELFGGVGEGQGRSKISLHVNHELRTSSSNFNGRGKMVPIGYRDYEVNVLDYLAYGHHDQGRPLTYIDQYFPENQVFTLEIKYRDHPRMAEVWEAINAWARFSGLGANHRNGWGKIWIKAWPEGIVRPPVKIAKASMKEYTSFSGKAIYFETGKPLASWHKALGEVGAIYYKSRKGMDAIRRPDGSKAFGERVTLSQPITLRDGNPKEMFLERHGKPLFIGIRPDGKGNFYGQILLMPYLYISQIRTEDFIKGKVKNPTQQAALRKSYEEMIDDLGKQFTHHGLETPGKI